MKLETIVSALGNYMRDAVVIAEAEPVDMPGPRVVWCNKAFTEMTGYAPEEIIGKTPRILQGKDTCPKTRARIRESLKTWKTFREQILNYTKDGEPFWAELDLQPIADESGWYHYWVAIQRDITERKAADQKLRENEERLKLATEGVSDGIWDLDLATGSVFFSKRNCDLLGLDGLDCLDGCRPGTWWLARVHPDDREMLDGAFLRHIKHDETYDVTYRIRHEDGSWRWWRSRGKARRDETGRAVRMLGVNSDVTHLKEAEQHAEAANRLKSQFLATMSHEIRTPLNGILGMTQLLDRSDLTVDQRSYVDVISSSGTALLSLINGVLDISRIEVGLLELETAPFEPRTLMVHALDAVRGIAARARSARLSTSWVATSELAVNSASLPGK